MTKNNAASDLSLSAAKPAWLCKQFNIGRWLIFALLALILGPYLYSPHPSTRATDQCS